VTTDTKVARIHQKEMTREQILVAATKLLAEKGYASLRVAEVAKEAAVSLGGHLHHFPSKESLVVAVLERLSTQVMRSVEADAAQDTEGTDILLLIAQSALRFYGRPEFLIYLDIFLSERRHTFVGDKAIALTASQRIAIEALWLPHVTARGIESNVATLLIRAIWSQARGLAISSNRQAKTAQTEIMMAVVDALRASYFRPEQVSITGKTY
jgi:AcrR family transcriptional regulator